MGVVVVEEDRLREIVREELQVVMQLKTNRESDEVLSVEEAAAFLGISKSKCYSLTKHKGFPGVQEKKGAKILIPKSALSSWLEQELKGDPESMEHFTRN